MADFAGQVWALAAYCDPPADLRQHLEKYGWRPMGVKPGRMFACGRKYHGSLLAAKEVATAARRATDRCIGNKTAAANRLAQIVMTAAEMGDGGTVHYTVATMAALRARYSRGRSLMA